MEKSVYVILLNYANYELTIDCINSIRESSYSNIKIIVVDNASPDDSGEKLSRVEDIIFLQAEYNNGFSAGNNIGIKYAISKGANYILLLNNDTVIDSKMISALVEASEGCKVVTPKMFFYDKDDQKDIIWYGGGVINKKRCDGIHLGLSEKDCEKYSKNKYVSFVTGCCVMLPTEVFEKVGLLDENYFMYCEDLDYSIRLANNCIDILYVPKAKLWHKVSSTSGGEMSKFIVYYVVRNRVYCAKKNKFGIKVIVIIGLETMYRVLKSCFNMYYKTYKIAPKAFLDGVFGRMNRNKDL